MEGDRVLLILCAALLAAVAVLTALYLRSLRRVRAAAEWSAAQSSREEQNQALLANYLRQRAELAELQSQINPHFLFNTLDSIRGLALTQGADDVSDMIEALSSMFRSNLRKTETLVTLADEIQSVENYLFIQKFRFRDKFEFLKSIEMAEGDLKRCLIPHFTLQPIVENAIYHGLETKTGSGVIKLVARRTAQGLTLRVSDNGRGIPSEKLAVLGERIDGTPSVKAEADGESAHTGIGLANINQRIKMQFGQGYGLTLASTYNIGTQVEIFLPFTEGQGYD
ncbi:MAG: sensor histidine kinase [Clostridiales Family XIII bacterium]|nr:sensor histidine kinase [Clostridiales Family XIII bacterium]